MNMDTEEQQENVDVEIFRETTDNNPACRVIYIGDSTDVVMEDSKGSDIVKFDIENTTLSVGNETVVIDYSERKVQISACISVCADSDRAIVVSNTEDDQLVVVNTKESVVTVFGSVSIMETGHIHKVEAGSIVCHDRLVVVDSSGSPVFEVDANVKTVKVRGKELVHQDQHDVLVGIVPPIGLDTERAAEFDQDQRLPKTGSIQISASSDEFVGVYIGSKFNEDDVALNRLTFSGRLKATSVDFIWKKDGTLVAKVSDLGESNWNGEIKTKVRVFLL